MLYLIYPHLEISQTITYQTIITDNREGLDTYRFPSFEYKVEDTATSFGRHLLPLLLLPQRHYVARGKRLRQTDSASCYHVDFRYLIIAQS